MQRFARLPESERNRLQADLTDKARAALAYTWDGWQARPAQLPPTGPWRFWLVMAGRGFGKTRIGAEELRKAAKRVRFPNIIGATADDARDIMIEGESGILAVCPPWERPEYRPSRRCLDWPNGARTLIFTADEPERLRGKQHEWLWPDEVAAWRYPEAWDQAMFGLRLGPNPQAVVTTTPKPTKLVRDLVANPHCIVTRGSTYDNLDNLAEAFAREIITKYEGTRLGRQELDGELLEDAGLAYQFDERIHVVQPFEIPGAWERFASFDFGWTNPSALLLYAVDYSGNVLVTGGLYEPGLPSELAPMMPANMAIWADPSIWNKSPTARWGQPLSAADEFADHGVNLLRANNDRRAGYVRVAEMLKRTDRRFADWHHDKGQPDAPMLYVFDVPGTAPLREQLLEAALETREPGPYQGRFPGEAVSEKQESAHLHAHASLRYGLMSRPAPSIEPAHVPSTLEEIRKARLQEIRKRRTKEAREDVTDI